MNQLVRKVLKNTVRLQSTFIVNPNLLYLRVGQITDVQFHPDADKLYVSQVSLGDEESVQVCSGLVGLIEQNQLLNSKVVVVCNLKPSKMRGVLSQGMLLCAEKVLGEGKYEVHPILEPENAQPGDELIFLGAEHITKKNRVKGKVWDSIVEGLKTDNGGRVIWTNGKDDKSVQLPLVILNKKDDAVSTVPMGFENCQVR